jgi:hypothetical protein
LVTQIKLPDREADNYQRHKPYINDQPAATDLTLRVASVKVAMPERAMH